MIIQCIYIKYTMVTLFTKMCAIKLNYNVINLIVANKIT